MKRFLVMVLAFFLLFGCVSQNPQTPSGSQIPQFDSNSQKSAGAEALDVFSQNFIVFDVNDYN